MELTFEEARVLGALAEKELATPEYYPMTLNGLVAACNQKTGRDPVSDLSDADVHAALDELYRKRLVGQVSGSGSRVVKFRHTLAETLGLDRPRRAVLALLMLRGSQTVGELRGRSARLFAFDSADAVEGVLRDLAAGDPPLAARLDRMPGQKEARFVHLLSGTSQPGGPPEPPPRRTDRVEEELALLREALDTLRADFEAFRASFE